MEYKALVSFSGAISMSMGEVREIEDPAIVNDLLKAGYIQPNAGPEPRARSAVEPATRAAVKIDIKPVDNEPKAVKEAVEKSKLKDNQSAPRVRGQKGGKKKSED